VPGSYFATLGVSYSAEATSFRDVDASSFFAGQCTRNCFRSNLGVDLTHDTRIDLPFASAGGLQSITADFTGGPLGGTVAYQRYLGEFRAYAPLAQFGGRDPGSQPRRLVLGLSGRAGAVFGNVGPFFQYQSFALGGVQFGQSLRGYPEFSITPRGFDPAADNFSAASGREAFGNAFMTLTAELGLRFNQQLYVNAFYDAGNNYARPTEFNPTRLFRGAGIGLSVVTPLGPLGLDWAYGFDRRSFIDPTNRALGTRPDPKWQLHFKLGQLF
jgi:outer membrane protein insertion porin family